MSVSISRVDIGSATLEKVRGLHVPAALPCLSRPFPHRRGPGPGVALRSCETPSASRPPPLAAREWMALWRSAKPQPVDSREGGAVTLCGCSHMFATVYQRSWLSLGHTGHRGPGGHRLLRARAHESSLSA
jgi:hypothetical protein